MGGRDGGPGLCGLSGLSGLVPVEDDVITGTILAYGAAAVPGGYLPCDGAAVSRTTYAALFATIGVGWGVGDGSTTFNVPDLRGRAVIGSGTGAGLSPRTLADPGGVETHVLTLAESPAHTHSTPNMPTTLATCLQGATPLGNVITVTGSVATDSKGGGGAHQNMMPFCVVTWIIKT